MGFIKTLLVIILVLGTIFGVVLGSLVLVTENPLDNSHVHELSLVEAKAPTCNEPGVKMHYACSSCDEIFADKNGYAALEKAEITIKALDHKWKSATCGSAKFCEICDATEGEALVHTGNAPVEENVVSATCMEGGSYDSVVYCKYCNEEMSREAKTTPISDHSPKAAVKEDEQPATCSAEGSYDSVVYCKYCNEEISRVNVTTVKLAHTPDDPVEENKQENCSTEGFYDSVVYCLECGAELNRETKTIAPSGHIDVAPKDGKCDQCGSTNCSPDSHIEVIDAAVPATCTEAGKTEGKHCSVCGTVIIAQQTVPAAHTYEVVLSGNLAIAVDGSVDASGVTATLVCQKCPVTETASDFTVNAENIFTDGATVTIGEYTGIIAAVNLTNYDASANADYTAVVYTAEDITVTVSVPNMVIIGGIPYTADNLTGANIFGATITHDYKSGEYTLVGDGAELGAIDVRNAVLNISGTLSVTTDEGNALYAKNGKVNFTSGEVTFNGPITTDLSFLLITGGAIVNANGQITTIGETVENKAVEYGYEYRLFVRDGTLNATNNRVNSPAIASGSIAVGSVVDDTKGYVNVTNTSEKGNAFNNKGITRWMFANGEINCIGGSSMDASAFVFNAEASNSFNLDMLRGIKITMKNYAYGFYSSAKNRYVSIEQGTIIEYENVNILLRGHTTNNNFYPQAYVQMEYTKDGKTALANVKVRLGAVSFKGEHTSLDFFTYPTAENNAGVTFISWVEE